MWLNLTKSIRQTTELELKFMSSNTNEVKNWQVFQFQCVIRISRPQAKVTIDFG